MLGSGFGECYDYFGMSRGGLADCFFQHSSKVLLTAFADSSGPSQVKQELWTVFRASGLYRILAQDSIMGSYTTPHPLTPPTQTRTQTNLN